MIPWHSINTVLLDMDGTLLDLHFDNYFWLEYLPQRYAQYREISLEAAHAHIHQQIARFEGTLQWYCLDHWSALLGVDIPALKTEIAHKINIRTHSLAFLAFLRDNHKRIILITNAHRASLSLKLARTGIEPALDVVISSHDYQAPKESQHFWQQLAAAQQFDNASTLFIDDTPRILRSAQQFGIAHLLCITHPDSAKPPRSPEEFTGIADFDQIMPAGRRHD